MIPSGKRTDNQNGLIKYLSPLAVWALAFGCSVGWGSFVMPGTTFLPTAGPLGSIIGLLIGAGIMLVIGVNYHILMNRNPSAGGAYSYAAEALGLDHGFLCGWMLIITYAAIIWANSTALSLIVRFVFGDIFCFGFSYSIAGYTVYLGEVLLSAGVTALACLVCLLGRAVTKYVQIISAVLLFLGITACFVAVAVKNGGFSRLSPAFSDHGSPASQILGIVILTPWAFVGFESISHSTGEFRFSPKRSLPVMAAALVTGALAYIMLTVCASLAVPDGFSDWSEYIGSLKTLEGLRGLPTFYAAREAMGELGPTLLGGAAFCGIFTGLIANMVALSRLLFGISRDGLCTPSLGRLNRRGVPSRAIILTGAASLLIPMLGRTAIGWIVDVTTIGATIIYAYTSLSAFAVGRREKNVTAIVTGICGMAVAVFFTAIYLFPIFSMKNRLSTESYLILVLWSVLGMLVFRILIQRDTERRMAKSEVVWIILLALVLLVSLDWINQLTSDEASAIADDISEYHLKQAAQAGLTHSSESVTATEEYITVRVREFSSMLMKSILVLAALTASALSVIFSIFSVIKKREKQSESERLLAEESSKAKSVFLSNMSHDIRTPMNAVTGYTALALKEENVPPKVRGYLEKIDISSSHLLSLINDILDMSRIESGKLELDLAPADLTRILGETESIFAVTTARKKLTFSVDCSGIKNKYVICDSGSLQRILLNLISNACKFTPEGGSVSVTLTEKESGGSAREYVLTVADTGIGMSPEFAEHIFDAFERERTDTVKQIQGTGLGMAITKSLVELMGGTIEVKTRRGEGTVFTVSLSLEPADEAEIRKLTESEVTEAEPVDRSGIKILITDDNPINTEIADAILTDEGFKTDRAENGKIALKKIAEADEDEYSLVLMDIRMPVMNGYEAARAIRELEGSRGRIPIVAISANTYESDRRAAAEAGMNAHVAKPFKPEELVKTIEELTKKA